MKASIFFRIAAVLIVLFAGGHTFGFRQVDPKWGIGGMLSSMQSLRFQTQGFNRTYWDFYVGFGLFVTVLLLLAAVVSWQLGAASVSSWTVLRPVAWSLTLCFALVIYLSARYFFAAPVVFSSAIFVCLAMGTLLAGRTVS